MTIIIRRALPVLISLYMALTLAGCATTSATATLAPEEPARHTVAELNDELIAGSGTDPWISTNKSIYKFNYNLDKYVLLPVVNGYEYVMPTVGQTGVSNFFNNINEIRTFYNSLLQGKGEKSLITFSRFVTNSILGIGGLFDPATHFDLKRQKEDFGQTLGVWGAPTGPYFVMPALGPSTVRSTGGFLVDSGIHSGIKTALDLPDSVSKDNGQEIQTGVTVLKTIDNRHQQPFRYLDSGYPFEYELVRYFYRQSREMEVKK